MDESTRELRDAALAARQHSYSPYSNYAVGAAVRTTDGAVFAACNVENVAFPEGVCAEGGAISMMVAGSNGVPTISEVVVVTDGDTPGTPCGGCRQKIREFGDPSTTVHCITVAGAITTTTLERLLPDSFGPDRLL